MPTNAELRTFVDNEGWQDKDKKSGRKTGDHHRYTLVLATGDVLYTRISHGSGGVDDPALFAEILRNQLKVTKEQFWACVKDGTLPPRPCAAPAPPANAIDAKLARNLLRKVGLTSADLAGLDQARAVEVWQRYLAGEPPPYV